MKIYQTIHEFTQSAINTMNQSTNKLTARLAGTICIVVFPAVLSILFAVLAIVMYKTSEMYWHTWAFAGPSMAMLICTGVMVIVAILDRRRVIRQLKEKELKEKEVSNYSTSTLPITSPCQQRPNQHEMQPTAPPYMRVN